MQQVGRIGRVRARTALQQLESSTDESPKTLPCGGIAMRPLRRDLARPHARIRQCDARARKRASKRLSCWQHGDSSEVLGGLAAVQSVIQRQAACRPLFLTVHSVACRVFSLGLQAWPAAGKRHFAIALGLLLLGNCQCANALLS